MPRSKVREWRLERKGRHAGTGAHTWQQLYRDADFDPVTNDWMLIALWRLKTQHELLIAALKAELDEAYRAVEDR